MNIDYATLETDRFYKNLNELDSLIITKIIKNSLDLKYKLFVPTNLKASLSNVINKYNRHFKIKITPNFFIQEKMRLSKYIDSLIRSFFGYKSFWHQNLIDFKQNDDNNTLDLFYVEVQNVDPYENYNEMNLLTNTLYKDLDEIFIKNIEAYTYERFKKGNTDYNIKFEIFSSIRYELEKKSFIYSVSTMVYINDKPYLINDPYNLITMYLTKYQSTGADASTIKANIEDDKSYYIPKTLYKKYKKDVNQAYRKCKAYYRIRNRLS